MQHGHPGRSGRGSRGRGLRRDNRNPQHVPDPAFDVAASFASACREINELGRKHGRLVIDGCIGAAMQTRQVALMEETASTLGRILEDNDA